MNPEREATAPSPGTDFSGSDLEKQGGDSHSGSRRGLGKNACAHGHLRGELESFVHLSWSINTLSIW